MTQPKTTSNDRVLQFFQQNAEQELTIAQIASATGIREGSVGSRIRDLRTYGYEIGRRHTGNGVHVYTYTTPVSAPVAA